MTTLNLQVSAAGDDGRYAAPSDFSPTGSFILVGQSSGNIHRAWYRFTGVSGLSGATVSSATHSLWGDNILASGTPLTKVFADAAASPAAPISVADAAGRTRTTVGVDWDGQITNDAWNEKDVTTVVQEIADNFDPSAILLLQDDDGSPNGHTMSVESYDGEPIHAAKLDIDYTAGGGGDPVSVEVPAGAIEATGLAPTVTATAHVSVSPAIGELEITGLAPTVTASAHQSVEVGAGSLEVTGLAPTVTATAHVSAAPGAGAIEATGLPPTISTTANVSISVGAASLEVTGLAPTVTATGHVSVSPDAGALEVTGLAPTVTAGANVSVSPATAALEVTGHAPTVTASNAISIEVGAGSIHATGHAPEVLTPVEVVIAAANLAMSGLAPTVTASDHQGVAVPTGAIDLQPFAPTVTGVAPVSVSPGVASLVITAYAPEATTGSIAYLTAQITVSAGISGSVGVGPAVSGTVEVN